MGTAAKLRERTHCPTRRCHPWSLAPILGDSWNGEPFPSLLPRDFGPQRGIHSCCGEGAATSVVGDVLAAVQLYGPAVQTNHERTSKLAFCKGWGKLMRSAFLLGREKGLARRSWP